MKTINFNITVDFDEKITDDNEIKEVAQNILNGIVRQTEECGLTPFDSETVATKIVVSEQFTKTVLIHSF